MSRLGDQLLARAGTEAGAGQGSSPLALRCASLQRSSEDVSHRLLTLTESVWAKQARETEDRPRDHLKHPRRPGGVAPPTEGPAAVQDGCLLPVFRLVAARRAIVGPAADGITEPVLLLGDASRVERAAGNGSLGEAAGCGVR